LRFLEVDLLIDLFADLSLIMIELLFWLIWLCFWNIWSGCWWYLFPLICFFISEDSWGWIFVFDRLSRCCFLSFCCHRDVFRGEVLGSTIWLFVFIWGWLSFLVDRLLWGCLHEIICTFGPSFVSFENESIEFLQTAFRDISFSHVLIKE